MPTDTFLRLNEGKRKNITRCATNAFSANGFTGASMDSVAEAAGVAKGALYRYFINKKDMYLHVVDALREDTQQYITEFLEQRRGQDVFDTMRDWLVSSYTTQERFDTHRKVLCNVLYQESIDFKEEVLARFGNLSSHYVKLAIQKGIASGTICEEINLEAAAFIVQCVEDRFHDGVTIPFLDMGYALYNQPQAVLEYKADQIIDLLRRALGKQKPTHDDSQSDERNDGSISA
jgi:AcrR family transcriptional regulator